jgi:hypothetical protein
MLVSIALQLAPLFIGLLGVTAGWFAGRASNR